MNTTSRLIKYLTCKILTSTNLNYLLKNNRSCLKNHSTTSGENFYSNLHTSNQPFNQPNLKFDKNSECFSAEVFVKSSGINCSEVIPYENKSYLTVITVDQATDDSDLLKDFSLSEDFKNILSRSLFHYDISLVNLSVRGHPISPTETLTSNFVNSGQNHLVNATHCGYRVFNEQNQSMNFTEKLYCQGPFKEDIEHNSRPSEQQLLNVIDCLCDSLMNFFEKPQNFSVYHKNILFQNNIKGITTRGLSAYAQQMYILKLYGHFHYAKVKVEILKITHHTDDGTVRLRWRVNGVSRHKVLLLFWKLKNFTWQQFLDQEAEWIDGFSVFSVDGSGLIYKHVCDKMMPDNDELAAKNVSLRTRLLKLLGLSVRPSVLSGVIACPLPFNAYSNLKCDKTK